MHEGRPISAEIKREAATTLKDLMSNPDFTKRYLAGGNEERRQMYLLNIIKLAPVAA